jgi:hypothetical protein
MDRLDSTIANMAAPAMRADLGGAQADRQWIAALMGVVWVPRFEIEAAPGLTHLEAVGTSS